MPSILPDPKKGAEAKELGNAAYKKGRWSEAIGHYTTASLMAPGDAAPLLNRAQSYLKLQKWNDAARDCTSVLALPKLPNPTLVKAHYRRALSRVGLGEKKLAEEDLREVLKLDPANSAAKEELSSLGASSTKSLTPPNPPVLPLASLPARNRGTNIPVHVVPRFSPLSSPSPPSLPSPASPASLPTAPAAPPVPDAPEQSFAAKKLDRKKKTYAAPLVTEVPQERKAGPSKVKPPATCLEFGLRWERMSGVEEGREKWEMITSLPPTQLAHLLGPSIEPDLLGSLFQSLHTLTKLPKHDQEHLGVSKPVVKGYLDALRGMPRWVVMEGLLSGEERGWIEGVKGWCA